MILTHLTRLTDTVIKQGDRSSRIGFRLKSNDQRDFNGPAKVQLINDQGQVRELVADVKANQLYLGFDEVLPADTYTVEVEIDGYVFPSAKDRKITIRPNVDLDESEEIITLKRLSVQEEVQAYLARYEAGQIDLDALMDRLQDRLPKPTDPYDDSTLKEELEALKQALEAMPKQTGSGKAGMSAFDLAKLSGFEGTLTDWLVSLKGDPGRQGQEGEMGPTGLSAYEEALREGFKGTKPEWLESLKGEQVLNLDGGHAGSKYDEKIKGIDGGKSVWQ